MATVMVAKVRQVRRERLGSVHPLLLCILPLAIPVAIFHFISGRIGNGLIASGAVLAGAIIVLLCMRGYGESRPVPAQSDESNGRDDGDDGSAWLDGPTDQPLPGPFQEVWETIMRDGVRVEDHEPARPREHHQPIDAD